MTIKELIGSGGEFLNVVHSWGDTRGATQMFIKANGLREKHFVRP
jgi:hypothetical protein